MNKVEASSKTWEGEAWMASSLPMRARHVTDRANVLRAFPLRLNSISDNQNGDFGVVEICETWVNQDLDCLAGRNGA